MNNEKGLTLIEVIIAIAILGIIGIAFFGALSTASSALIVTDERATAESLARSQMEYIKNQPYDGINNPPQYTLLSDIPDGYDIDVITERLDPKGDGTDNDDGIQKITVTVSHQDEVITLEGYKANR